MYGSDILDLTVINFMELATAPDKLLDLFINKIRQCRVVFDFTKPLSEVSQKDIKQDALLEIVDFIVSARGYFTLIVYKEITEMVSTYNNLFDA